MKIVKRKRICGFRRSINGKEWVCIKEPHPGDKRSAWSPILPKDCHGFVRRERLKEFIE